MDIFRTVCSCGGNADIFSCVKVKENVVEITYICNKCGNSESVERYLYKTAR